MKKCERVVENIFSITFSRARATKHLNLFFWKLFYVEIISQ